MNNLFSYSDYRSYLKSFYEDKKRANPRWTYGVWAKQMGLKDNSSIIKIIRGQRQAGPEVTKKLISYFQFTSRESMYFQDLIHLAKANKDPSLTLPILQKIKLYRHLNDFHILPEEDFRVISQWIFYALRQMSKLNDFRMDAQWISEQLLFQVTPTQVKEALDTLQKKGLLLWDSEKKCWSRGKGKLDTTDDVASEAIKRFHEGSLDNAKIILRDPQVPVVEREFDSFTLAFNSKDLASAKEYLRKVMDDFAVIYGREVVGQSDRVYQLQLQFYPLTKLKKENLTELQPEITQKAII